MMDDDIKLKSNRTQSMRSVRSTRASRSGIYYAIEEKTLELDECIKLACIKFPCPFRVVVKKETQIDEFSKLMNQESAIKYKRISVAPAYARAPAPAPPPTMTPESTKEPEEAEEFDENLTPTLTITAYYDPAHRLAEILLHKINVPLILIKILGLIVPKYQYLTKIALKRCRITGHTLYELNRFMPLSSITDISFDDSPVLQGNFALLLETNSKLANLSLCRCNINDEVCRQIASKLHTLNPAEATLTTLNLSSNRITDVGAKYLGEALRTNRHLRYLNLAANQIGDEGANHIFNALTDFPLTCNEIMNKRRKYMAYLTSKQEIYLKYVTDMDCQSLDDFSMYSRKSKKATPSSSTKSKAKKEKLKSSATVEDFMHVRAEMIANEIVGTFEDPFVPCCTRLVNGYCHCLGNMVLCYLNLNYNDLTYLSLKKLQKVLFYQSVNKTPNETGLLRVLLDGNRLPAACSELERISEMLHRNVVNFSAKYTMNKLNKARARISRISVVPERIMK